MGELRPRGRADDLPARAEIGLDKVRSPLFVPISTPLEIIDPIAQACRSQSARRVNRDRMPRVGPSVQTELTEKLGRNSRNCLKLSVIARNDFERVRPLRVRLGGSPRRGRSCGKLCAIGGTEIGRQILGLYRVLCGLA